MKSQFAMAIRAIERARSIRLPTAGSRAAVEILVGAELQLREWQISLADSGDAIAQDDEWQAHETARRLYPRAKREIETLRAEVVRAKQEGLV